MICTEGKLRPSEIRPEVSAHYHSSQHLPRVLQYLRCDEQHTTGVCGNHLPIVLKLAQDTSHSKQTGVHVENKTSTFGGKTQDRNANEACLQGLECRLLPVRPDEGGSPSESEPPGALLGPQNL